MAITVSATLPIVTATAVGQNQFLGTVLAITQLIDAAGNLVGFQGANASAGSALLNITATATGTNNSADQTSTGRGANIFLNVTAVSATCTLRLNFQSKDPVSGNYLTLYTVSVDALATGSTAFDLLQVYPGAVSLGTANMFVAPFDAGLTWRAQVSITATASQGGANIVYTIGAVALG